MQTLTEPRPGIHAEAPAVLDPTEVRRAAITCIAVGNAPAILRGYARQYPDSRHVPWWVAAADEAEGGAWAVTAKHQVRKPVHRRRLPRVPRSPTHPGSTQ
jgi:hypothetical protein